MFLMLMQFQCDEVSLSSDYFQILNQLSEKINNYFMKTDQLL